MKNLKYIKWNLCLTVHVDVEAAKPRYLLLLLNAGVNTAVAPVYLSEIAPVRLRGSLGVLNQFGVVTGILVGFIFGLTQVCA